jgi:hypothetical protein
MKNIDKRKEAEKKIADGRCDGASDSIEYYLGLNERHPLNDIQKKDLKYYADIANAYNSPFAKEAYKLLGINY